MKLTISDQYDINIFASQIPPCQRCVKAVTLNFSLLPEFEEQVLTLLRTCNMLVTNYQEVNNRLKWSLVTSVAVKGDSL
jgi:hypothetical protein